MVDSHLISTAKTCKRAQSWQSRTTVFELWVTFHLKRVGRSLKFWVSYRKMERSYRMMSCPLSWTYLMAENWHTGSCIPTSSIFWAELLRFSPKQPIQQSPKISLLFFSKSLQHLTPMGIFQNNNEETYCWNSKHALRRLGKEACSWIKISCDVE